MRSWRLLAAFAVSLFFAAPSFAEEAFVQDDLATGVVRFPATLRKEAGGLVKRPAAQLESDGLAALSQGEARRALDLFGAAIALDEKNAAPWLGYAGAAIVIEPRDFAEQYTLRGRVLTAAYGAYQRGSTGKDKAKALVLLGRVFADLGRWRPALDAYARASPSTTSPSAPDLRGRARAEHGFRILDYKVDSDAAAPRVCFKFSETVASGKTDFAPFVAVSGAANAAVTAEGSQVCVDGLKHGERYAIVLRQGLPSAVGETLLKSADYEIYVRDRAPAGALHRPQLRPAAHRPGGRAAGLGQRAQARRRGAAHRRPQPAADPALRGFPGPAQRRHRPDRSPTRRASRSGRAPSTPPRPS